MQQLSMQQRAFHAVSLVFAVLLGFLPLKLVAQAYSTTSITTEQLTTPIALEAQSEWITRTYEAGISEVIFAADWSTTTQPKERNNQFRWQRLLVRNQQQVTQQLRILATNQFLNQLEIYVVDQRQRILVRHMLNEPQFSLQPNNDKNNRSGIFPADVIFTIKPNQTLSIYVHQFRNDSPAQVVLSRAEVIAKQLDRFEYLMMILLAVACTLAIASFVQLLTSHHPVYLWSMLLFGSITATTGVVSGLLNLTWLGVATIDALAICVVLVLFAHIKLQHRVLYRLSKLHRFLVLAALVPLSLLAFIGTTELRLQHFGLIAVLSVAHTFICGLIYIRQSISQISVYLLAIGLFMLGIGLSLLADTTAADLIIQLGAFQFAEVSVLCAMLLIQYCAALTDRLTAKRLHDQNGVNDQHTGLAADTFYHQPQAGLVTNANGQLITINEAAARLLGGEVSQINHINDYLVHERDAQILIADLFDGRRPSHRQLLTRRARGEQFWCAWSGRLLQRAQDTFLVMTLTDISGLQALSNNMQYSHTFDALSGLYNRQFFISLLDDRIDGSEGKDYLFLINIDGFNEINERHGYTAGDLTIKHVGEQLRQFADDQFFLGRIGADEFGVIAHLEQDAQVNRLANELMDVVVGSPVPWAGRQISLRASVGILPLTTEVGSGDRCLNKAELAVQQAKQRGGNQSFLYHSKLDASVHSEYEQFWKQEIDNAFTDERLTLFYEPILNLHSASEQLRLRTFVFLRSKGDTLFAPHVFGDIAEKNDQQRLLDHWLFERTLLWINDLNVSDHGRQILARCSRFHIPLSIGTLVDSDSRLFMHNAFKQLGVGYDRICFDIPQPDVNFRRSDVISFMSQFSVQGCQFAMRDFSSNFSNFDWLTQIPLQLLYLDERLTQAISDDSVKQAILQGLCHVCMTAQVQTIAHATTNKHQQIEFGKYGVDYLAGYGFQGPLPITQLDALIKTVEMGSH